MKARLASVVRGAWRALGPGVITGAADDDPSGIATYSLAGAQLGTGLLWTALITWPLMAAVQSMCARIGMVTGRGLMAALRHKFRRRVLALGAAALLLANTINIGADLSGMADAAQLLTRVDSHVWVVLFGGGIAWTTIRLRHGQMQRSRLEQRYKAILRRICPDIHEGFCDDTLLSDRRKGLTGAPERDRSAPHSPPALVENETAH